VETDVRAVIVAFVSGAALAAISAQAAPLAPQPPGPVIYMPNQEWAPLPNDTPSLAPFGAAPSIELVAQGCRHGWHRPRWRDHFGYWHWGHCVPNGGPHDAWSAGWNHPYSDWRGPSGGWGNP
jgi:hypothetical protein